jgi:hypothetical protein
MSGLDVPYDKTFANFIKSLLISFFPSFIGDEESMKN